MKLFQNLLLALGLVPLSAHAQGTFVFDQQSSDESNLGSTGYFIQTREPMGQSFTPSLSAIGFVRFNLYDQIRNNGTGAVVYVNLRSDSITGSLVDSTAPVSLPDNFGPGPVNFFFPSNLPIQAGVQYYFQLVVQSGNLWTAFGDAFNYPGGDLWVDGNSTTLSDLWFREGIVPEPSAATLMLFGGAFWFMRRRYSSAG